MILAEMETARVSARFLEKSFGSWLPKLTHFEAVLADLDNVTPV